MLDQIAREKGVEPAAVEVWVADEARVGQKNKITRRGALRGTRPAAPKNQRMASSYIFGAVCPREGKGAALVLPFCHTAAMALHLTEIATAVAPGAHAVLLLDQAGWHVTACRTSIATASGASSKPEGLNRRRPAASGRTAWSTGTFRDYDPGFIHLDIKPLPMLQMADFQTQHSHFVAINRSDAMPRTALGSLSSQKRPNNEQCRVVPA